MLDMTTVARCKQYLKIREATTQEDDMLAILITAASVLIAEHLDRHILIEERTEYRDVCDSQRLLWLQGWPVKLDPGTGLPLLEIKNDINYPQDWSGDALAQGDDYLLYNGERGLGKIEMRYHLVGGPQALRIIYTAGMATRTTLEGTSGACAAGPPDTFTDANATFVDDMVEAGMTLVVTSTANGNAGTYTITSVDSQTQLTISETWPGTTPSTDEVYSIPEAGFVALYPDIEQACLQQVAYWYKRKETPEVSAIANAGGNVTYTQTRAIDVKLYGTLALRPEVMLLLRTHKQPDQVWV